MTPIAVSVDGLLSGELRERIDLPSSLNNETLFGLGIGKQVELRERMRSEAKYEPTER
jgi:hypothetical protein